MQRITLREIIKWVEKNFPATIVDEVSRATVTMCKNAILQDKLHQLEKQIEETIEEYSELATVRMELREILGGLNAYLP